MNYLAHSTLKTFLYLLYGKSSLLLFNFKDPDREKVIKDIYSNNLSSLFIFKNSEVTFKDPTKEDITANLFDISPNIENLEIQLPKSNRKKLINFISKYVSEYKRKGELDSTTYNFCSFDVSYKESMDLLRPAERYGGKINIKIPVNEKSKTVFYKSDLRFLDILFYLLGEDFIDISVGKIKKISHEVAEDIYEDELLFPLTIIFKKPLEEISDTEETWIRCGTLSINTITALARYEDNEHPFQSTGTNNFRLLYYLIKNPGIYILITEIYSFLNPKDSRTAEEAFSKKKEAIVALVKNIRDKLKMTKKKNPSAQIIIKGKHIILNCK